MAVAERGRKTDCSLDEFVADYLKKQKFSKTLKLFYKERFPVSLYKKSRNTKIYGKFFEFLKTKDSEEAAQNDDLGFEINFGHRKTETTRKNANGLKVDTDKRKVTRVKKPKTAKQAVFEFNRRKNRIEKGVTKYFDDNGAIVTITEKSKNSKNFWKFIKERGFNRPGLHNGYC